MANGFKFEEITEKTTVADNDMLLLGDSEDLEGINRNVKSVKIQNLVLNQANVAGRLFLHINTV